MEALTRSAPPATRIGRSPTAELEAAVETLVSGGVQVWRLGMGEPDIPTPQHVRDAATLAIRENFSHYTSTAGIQALRVAAAARLRADIGVEYTPAEVVVSVGGKHAIFNGLATLVGADDEVLIPIPYWVSFPEQVRFIGAVPVFVPAAPANGYRASADDIERLVTPRTRVLILNSPNNPSGAVYGSRELDEIAAVCQRHDLWVISDEVYSTFTYTDEGHVSIASRPGMRERTIVVNAVSKTYGMTGWRIGYAAAPGPIASAMVTVQSHMTSNPSSIAQRGALAALVGPQDWLAGVRADYAERRLELAAGVRRIRGLSGAVPDGSFFLWVDMSWWVGRSVGGRRIGTADDLAAVLLDNVRVAVMPGNGFGSPTNLRLSFAAPRAEVSEGVERMIGLLGPAGAVD